MSQCADETDSYIFLTWGKPPVRNHSDYWTWSDYREEVRQWTARLPKEFLRRYGYSTQDGGYTDHFYFGETDMVIRDLRHWIENP